MAEEPVLVVWTTSYNSVTLDIPCSTGSFGVTDYLNKKTNTLTCNSGGKIFDLYKIKLFKC